MENLQAQIEERINVMVGDVFVLLRRAANEAINNALSGTSAAVGSGAGPKRGGQRRASKLQAKRSQAELKELSARLYLKIDEQPGQGMAVYAEALAVAARDLGVVMRRLKKEGRVRAVGERDRTRYYPMDPS